MKMNQVGLKEIFAALLSYDDMYINLGHLPCDTEAGLLYLKSLFPVEKFDRNFPAIIMKHQVYSIVHDKTTVDREMVCCVRRYFVDYAGVNEDS